MVAEPQHRTSKCSKQRTKANNTVESRYSRYTSEESP